MYILGMNRNSCISTFTSWVSTILQFDLCNEIGAGRSFCFVFECIFLINIGCGTSHLFFLPKLQPRETSLGIKQKDLFLYFSHLNFRFSAVLHDLVLGGFEGNFRN